MNVLGRCVRGIRSAFDCLLAASGDLKLGNILLKSTATDLRGGHACKLTPLPYSHCCLLLRLVTACLLQGGKLAPPFEVCTFVPQGSLPRSATLA